MKIVFDYQVFFLQRYGGISRYFYELARELSLLPGCDPSIVAPFHNNEYLTEHKSESFIYKMNPFVKKVLQNRSDEYKIKANVFCAKRQKPEILHETYYTHRFGNNARKVVTIHDMIYEQLDSGKAGEKEIIAFKKKAIVEARAVIAVSEHTKKDLLHFYPWASSKISVIHHGVLQHDASPVKSYQNVKPFILFVGHRGGYKNFSVLLEAYASDKNLTREFDLIAFGGDDRTNDEADFISSNRLEGNIHFFKGNDELLYSLYKGAAVFVYNSSYEGFGMPVLEAMRMGCPVICSNTTSLPEVAGDAAILVNPSGVAELTGAINKVVFNNDVRDNKINAGIARAKKFTWKKCAIETYEVYKNVMNG